MKGSPRAALSLFVLAMHRPRCKSPGHRSPGARSDQWDPCTI